MTSQAPAERPSRSRSSTTSTRLEPAALSANRPAASRCDRPAANASRPTESARGSTRASAASRYVTSAPGSPLRMINGQPSNRATNARACRRDQRRLAGSRRRAHRDHALAREKILNQSLDARAGCDGARHGRGSQLRVDQADERDAGPRTSDLVMRDRLLLSSTRPSLRFRH